MANFEQIQYLRWRRTWVSRWRYAATWPRTTSRCGPSMSTGARVSSSPVSDCSVISSKTDIIITILTFQPCKQIPYQNHVGCVMLKTNIWLWLLMSRTALQSRLHNDSPLRPHEEPNIQPAAGNPGRHRYIVSTAGTGTLSAIPVLFGTFVFKR